MNLIQQFITEKMKMDLCMYTILFFSFFIIASIDAIVVMKDGDRYIVRSILSKHDKFYHDSLKHVFLSIEYTSRNG